MTREIVKIWSVMWKRIDPMKHKYKNSTILLYAFKPL